MLLKIFASAANDVLVLSTILMNSLLGEYKVFKIPRKYWVLCIIDRLSFPKSSKPSSGVGVALAMTSLPEVVCLNSMSLLLKYWVLSWKIRGYLLPTTVLYLNLWSRLFSLPISKNCFLSLKELF